MIYPEREAWTWAFSQCSSVEENEFLGVFSKETMALIHRSIGIWPLSCHFYLLLVSPDPGLFSLVVTIHISNTPEENEIEEVCICMLLSMIMILYA